MLNRTVQVVVIVSVIGLLAFGALAVMASHFIVRPIPALAEVTARIAQGDFSVSIPSLGRNNELGQMAQAVEVFRSNGERVRILTENDQLAVVQRRKDRAEMLSALQCAFGEVADAAVQGDFSRRVDANFPDPELNHLAASINRLVETVSGGLGATIAVLSALRNADLTQRTEGDFNGALAEIRDCMNSVSVTLGGIVASIRTTSGSLKAATNEILAGANDLSERSSR